MAVKHTFYRNLSILLFCGILFSAWLNYQQYLIILNLKSQLHKAIPAAVQAVKLSAEKTQQTLDQVKVIYLKEDRKEKLDSLTASKENTKSPVVNTTDTIRKYLGFLGQSNKDRDYYKSQDSTKTVLIAKLQKDTATLRKDTANYIASRRNLQVIVQNFDEELSNLQAKKYDEKISLLIAPPKTAFGNSKNYLRVENMRDSLGKANGSKYYDTFIRNTENNSFFGQFRVSNNFSKAGLSALTAGAGLELKTGRFSTNFAWLWNVEHPQYNTSYLVLGGRFDIFRVRLP